MLSIRGDHKRFMTLGQLDDDGSSIVPEAPWPVHMQTLPTQYNHTPTCVDFAILVLMGRYSRGKYHTEVLSQ
eukprot:1774491-Karenia_brevis.AAC.1